MEKEKETGEKKEEENDKERKEDEKTEEGGLKTPHLPPLPASLLHRFGKRHKKTQHQTIMTSSPSATTVLPKLMQQRPNMVQRERDKCGRRVLSKPDRAHSPFPLQQFLEMMSLFIKKIEKEK